MRAKIKFKRFFAYSEEEKCFNTDFNSNINIVYGRNTSGKSTLIQGVLYTFGINDEKRKLDEVLTENVIFRLDFILSKEIQENVTVIRDDEQVIVKRENHPIKKFTGISGDKAEEHKKLKSFWADLFGFNLFLEISGEYKQASIEAMFLPYYIAQDVGWVYRHKSFRGLDFVKNFKEDFFDYYLGILNDYDRDEKRKLEVEKQECQREIRFLENIEKKNDKLHLSKLKDEKFILEANNYLIEFEQNKDELIKLEKEYLVKANKISYLEQRKSILSKVKNSLKKQNPLIDKCPTCGNKLNVSTEIIYEYYQDFNDTEKQLAEIKKVSKKLKDNSGEVNTLKNKIQIQRDKVARDYSILSKYQINNITFHSWLENKTNVQLADNILLQIGKHKLKLDAVIEKLKKFKTDKEIETERLSANRRFKSYFKNNLDKLSVKPFDNDRFYMLYESPAFPKQGVELLKTLLSYHFAFNKIILETEHIHRFPFLLDAIFEGDLEDASREKILDFISKNYPMDTQVIISIADKKDNSRPASKYNERFFKNSAKLICIGKNEDERAFLSEYNNKYDDYLEETILLLNDLS